ncbi:MAG: tail fiber domain-containing protein [bacterium]
MALRSRLAFSVLVVTFAGLVCAGAALGDVPHLINYQGRLADVDTGEPLSGSHEVVFRLYGVVVGGTELWSETHTLEADEQGVVSAILGGEQPLPELESAEVWLEVSVDGEVLAPRRRLVSVPFALRSAAADVADSLNGFDAAAVADSAHNHDGRYFMESELTTSGTINAPGNPVDWTKLKGVPAGFADGSDSTGGVGDGHSLDAADGSPTDALYVDDEGDVGIGTTNPQSRLHVEDSSAAGYTYAIRGVSSSTGSGGQMAGVVGETWSTATTNAGAGVMGFASSETGRSSGVVGIASGDNGAGVVGRADHPSGETYGVVGECASPSGWAGYFQGARSYFSGKVGIGWAATAQPRLYVRENSDLLYAEAIRGEATSASAHSSRGIVGTTNCADTVQTGAGVVGIAAGSVSKSSGVLGIADGARGRAVEGIAQHTSGENIAIKGSTVSPIGFGCHVSGARNYFSGKIGIGTETPQNPLHIHDSGGMSTVQITNTATGSGSGDGLHLAVTTDGTGILMNRENKALDLGVNSAAAMRINASGKISIGGLDTLGTVTITGSTPGLILNSTAPAHPYGDIDFYDSGTKRCGIHWSGTTNAMSIGFVHRLYISESGHVGFNSVPFNPLDVTEDGTTWGGVNGYTEVVGHFRNTSGGHTAVSIDAEANLDPILYLAENGTAYWDLRNDSDLEKRFELRYHGPGMKNNTLVSVDTLGNVGMGTGPDTTYRLNLAGKGYASVGWRTPGNVAIGTSDPGGYKLYVQGTAYSTGGWSSSDARLKDRIEPIAGALSKAIALKGVSFEWRRAEFPDRGLPEGRHYGLIAQEVEKVLPEAVQIGPDGDRAVAYNEIIPVLVEALKAQEARIQTLERQLENLQAVATDGQ